MIHFALMPAGFREWCSYSDPHGTLTRDAMKVTCWHCLGWLKFGPGKEVAWE